VETRERKGSEEEMLTWSLAAVDIPAMPPADKINILKNKYINNRDKVIF